MNPVTAFIKSNPWAYILLGLLIIAVLYVQGGPWGAIGTLGLIALGAIVVSHYVKH